MSEKKWYVVNTYSGYEKRAKLSLEERAKARGLQDKLGEVLIPTENVVEVRKGKRIETTRKFFPGYILVEMEMGPDMWHLVKDTPKVSGFIGGNSTTPVPVPAHEVARITNQIEEGRKEPTMIHSFEEGDAIKVVDGPFSNFNGVVEQVDEEKQRLKVLVQIFGRDTPVELEFSQVEKT
ncbi:MAG: transcription termination/antitermination protein NusG [Myxococcales bacterium]|nr:transcription termination/antitermination protein NusG [Myxococcales bacterium]